MTASLDIIIVNWNSGQLLSECLESIIATDRNGFELSRVVVVDNASWDGSASELENSDLPLSIIHNAENRGFAAACNQGVVGSRADYLLFLNPDARLFEDSLAKPISFLGQPDSQDVGIVGIQLVDENGEIIRSCARFPTPVRFFSKMLGLDRLFPGVFQSHLMLEWSHEDTRKVDHLIGAFFLVRRSLFESLDGFDERFFVYLEDVDFSQRARQAGWVSCYLASVQAYHKGGGTSERLKARRLFYSLRSNILYGYKHFGWLAATALMLGTLLLEPFARLTLASSRCSGKEMFETLKGYCMLWGALPELLKATSKRGDA